MPFKTPAFWYKNNHILQKILTPLSHIYKLGHKINMSAQKQKTVSIPVICIGNITAGGSGKTPTAIALSKLIQEEKIFKNPCFLTKGYGAKNQKTRRIEDHETVHDTGDEPKILSNHCNTIISKNRYDGAALAQNQGHDLIIMDDGFQNNTLKKDISLMVIDGKTGLGNGKLMPSGPLREPLKDALKRTNAVILISQDDTKIKNKIFKEIPIFKAQIKTVTNSLNKNERYLAFCGIAHPSKFFDTLQQDGYNIVNKKIFADHHPYSDKDIQNLKQNAQRQEATLITTRKDSVKIPKELQNNIKVLNIELVFDDKKQISDFLKNELSAYIKNK